MSHVNSEMFYLFPTFCSLHLAFQGYQLGKTNTKCQVPKNWQLSPFWGKENNSKSDPKLLRKIQIINQYGQIKGCYNMRVFRHAESICGLNFFRLALLLSRIWPHLVTTHAHYFFACFLHKAKCFCKTRQLDFAEYTPCNTCTMHKCRGCYTHNLIFNHYSLEKYMCLS